MGQLSNFINQGAISVTDGTLEINITSASYGPYSVSAGKTLRFAGSHDFDNNENEIITSAGTVEFSAGTVNITNKKTNAYNVTGGTSIIGAAVSFASDAVLTALGGTLKISSGSLNLSNQSTTVSAFDLLGGSLTGTGTLTTSTMTWSGGSMTGTGTTAVSTSLGLSSSLTLTGRSLTSAATTWNGVGSLSGTGAFTNTGTLTKSSTGTSSISLLDGTTVKFTQTGTVNVTNGVLAMNITGTSTGPYTISSGATLRFTGSHTFADAANEIIGGAGTVEFSAGTANVNSSYGPVGSTVVSGASATFTKLATNTGPFSVSGGTLKFSGSHDFTGTDTITGTGTGIVEFPSGTITIGSTYDVAGGTTVNGATLSVIPAATLTKLGGALTISSGSLDLGDKSTTADSFILSGGTLTGTGMLTTGTMTWSGGTMNGGGTTAVTTSLAISNDLILTGRTLTSAATSWSLAGSLTGTGAFSNSGTLTKSSTGTSSISLLDGTTVNFTQTGAVNITSGVLALNISSTSTGRIRFPPARPYTLPARIPSLTRPMRRSAGQARLSSVPERSRSTVAMGRLDRPSSAGRLPRSRSWRAARDLSASLLARCAFPAAIHSPARTASLAPEQQWNFYLGRSRSTRLIM